MVWGKTGAVMAALALVMLPIAGAPVANASTNLLTNGDFETGTTTGWKGTNATLTVSSVAHAGLWAGKLVYSGSGTTFTIKSSPKPVSSTTGGAVYTADGWFRSDTPGHNICLKVIEAGTQSGSSSACKISTSSWVALPEVNYTAKASGDTLAFQVIAKTPASGNSFEVDDLSLTTGCGATVCPPTNLHTSAPPSSTEVDLAWDPSPTSGVVSYRVYRGADCVSQNVIGTVSAPTKAFADKTVSANTTYDYAVDAFDGTNPSAKSNCLPVTTPPSGGTSKTIVAVGDISCDPLDPNFNGGLGQNNHCQEQGTANLVGTTPHDAVLPLGDLQYDCGSLANFNASYDKAWGLFSSSAFTYPVPGNHEYDLITGETGCSQMATGYFQYFASKGNPNAPGIVSGQGYYSFNIGTWHVIALNSDCDFIDHGTAKDGCAVGSPQETWLKSDLAANPTTCTLAFWHHARWSSKGTSQGVGNMQPIWADLANANADLVLVGHFHHYERFGDMNASGTLVPDGTGTREIIVGTGGEGLAGFNSTFLPASQVHNNSSFGIISVTLGTGTYSWNFIHSTGTFTDSGSDTCH